MGPRCDLNLRSGTDCPGGALCQFEPETGRQNTTHVGPMAGSINRQNTNKI